MFYVVYNINTVFDMAAAFCGGILIYKEASGGCTRRARWLLTPSMLWLALQPSASTHAYLSSIRALNKVRGIQWRRAGGSLCDVNKLSISGA